MKSLQPDGSVLITFAARIPPSPVGAGSRGPCTLTFSWNGVEYFAIDMAATLKNGHTYIYKYPPKAPTFEAFQRVDLLNQHTHSIYSAAVGGELFNYVVRPQCFGKEMIS
jgi:hypothetical protein